VCVHACIRRFRDVVCSPQGLGGGGSGHDDRPTAAEHKIEVQIRVDTRVSSKHTQTAAPPRKPAKSVKGQGINIDLDIRPNSCAWPWLIRMV
jgi:hypothetical protein